MEDYETSQKLDYVFSELSGILPDFKLLAQGVSLSDPGYKFFSFLTKDIKDSLFRELKDHVLKDITRSLEPVQHEIKKITEGFEHYKDVNKFKLREMDNSIESSKSKIDNLTIDKNAHAMYIDIINDALENIKEDILYRATYPEMNALASVVETKASRTELDEANQALQADIFTRVKLEQFATLEQFVNDIEAYTKTLTTIDSMQDNITELKKYTDLELTKYVLGEDFRFYKEDVKSEVQKIYQRNERHESLQGFTNDAIRKELALLDKAVKKRPWKKDIEIFRMNLQEAAKIIELQKHKETIIENLDDFKVIMEGFKQRCNNYEKILERFDEVLLDKAAKDDVSEVKKFLKLVAKSEDVDVFKTGVTTSFSEIEKQFNVTMEKFHNFEVLITQVNSAFRNFKSENKDTIHIKNSIMDLQSLMDSKAEKVDFLSISENLIKRDEINIMRNNLDVIHRQLEMGSVIMQSAIRTMVKSTESAVTKNKQRIELLKNATMLISWVGNSTSMELGSHLPTLQSGIFQKSYQDLESSSLLPSIKHNRKSSVSEVQPYNSMDVPKFKGKYEMS